METGRLQFITAKPADAEKACGGGVRWVQLRVKDKAEDEWRAIALDVRSICSKYGAALIVNDNLRIAMEVNADGVHLGKEDMNPLEARKIAGGNFIIGGTANTMEDIRRLNLQGVNYIGLGPYRFTLTKTNLSPVLGLEGYRNLVQQCQAENIHLPLIAIGGIQLEDVGELMNTGVHGIAVSSAISNSTDVIATAEEFLEKINRSVKYEKRFANHSR